jgi:hypothetical protein
MPPKAKEDLKGSIEFAFQTLDQISRKKYSKGFHELISDEDTRRISEEVRQISGVVLKLDYSDERQERTETKWRIDPERLERKSPNDWELRLLAAYPNRLPGETTEAGCSAAEERGASRQSLCTIYSRLCL